MVAGSAALAVACTSPEEQPEPPTGPTCTLSIEIVDSHIPTYKFHSVVEGAEARAATFNFGDGEEERDTAEPFISQSHSYITETGNYLVSSEVEIQSEASPGSTTIDCKPDHVIAIIPASPPQA